MVMRRRPLVAGNLDQRVQFDALVQTQDATGGIVPTWTTKGTVWACIDAVKSAGEPVITDGIRSAADLTVYIRAETFISLGLVVTDRMVWQGRNYDVSDIPNQQLRGRFIALAVRTGVNKG